MVIIKLITGTQIKRFYECSKERELRKHNSSLKGAKWGKICEKLYLDILDKGNSHIFEIVQSHINSNFQDLTIVESTKIIGNLAFLLKSMKNTNSQEIYKSNQIISDDKFAVEIDLIIRDKSGTGFIREFKSYSGPSYYAWNSDIAQLATQNIVLSHKLNTVIYYGEIVYLGNKKIIPINTKPYIKSINFARRKMIEGTNKIDCEHCSFLDFPCYNHVRYKNSTIETRLIHCL